MPPRNPVGTGRKMNVYKTFRRRSGRLLNVLCTFNLRPVSTGKLRQTINVGAITNEKVPDRIKSMHGKIYATENE